MKLNPLIFIKVIVSKVEKFSVSMIWTRKTNDIPYPSKEIGKGLTVHTIDKNWTV